MKQKITQLFFILFLAAANRLQAQAILGFDSTYSINFPSTVTQDDTSGFRVRLKNYGSTPVIDTIFIYSGYKNSQGIVLNVKKDSINPFNPSFLAASNTLSVYLTTLFSANRFPLGIDVVVIWPYAGSAITFDSLEYVPNILPPLQVAELLRDNGIKVFPNPFEDKITIQAQQEIKQIRFYTLDGKLIHSQSRQETIDLSQIKDAFYLVELTYKSGTKRWIKVEKNAATK